MNHQSRRNFVFFGALAGTALLRPATAAAQGVGRMRRAVPRKPTPDFKTAVVNESVPALADWTDTKARLVRRITMGATAAEMTRVRTLGYQEYLNEQLHPELIDDRAG